jgi:hypothetical protein
MKTVNHILCGLLLVVAMTACDSVDLTIGVAPGAPGTLEVVNANDAAWNDAHLLVEAVESDHSTTTCIERNIGSWRPQESIIVPACGEKIRFTLTTGSGTARFSYANGELFRVFGRKEVPVAPSTAAP